MGYRVGCIDGNVLYEGSSVGNNDGVLLGLADGKDDWVILGF